MPETPWGTNLITLHQMPFLDFGWGYEQDDETHEMIEEVIARHLPKKYLSLNETKDKLDYYCGLIRDDYNSLLRNLLPYLGGRKIDRCVCVGLGTFSHEITKARNPNPNSPHAHLRDVEFFNDSMCQLAILISIVSYIEQRQHGEIEKKYADDGAFTDTDLSLLDSVGFEASRNTSANHHLNSHTF